MARSKFIDSATGERMEVRQGGLLVGWCLDLGEPPPRVVSLDMFRGSAKLLALLTDPGAGAYRIRNGRFLIFNGGTVRPTDKHVETRVLL